MSNWKRDMRSEVDRAMADAEFVGYLRGFRFGVVVGVGGILAALAVARLVVLAMEATR